MKWNGRSYRPINQISIKKKEFNLEEALRPLGQKMHDTHWVANVYKEPQSSPIPPSPTPTNTTTPTPTPSSTPVLVDCTWSGTNINWEYNTNLKLKKYIQDIWIDLKEKNKNTKLI